MKFCFQVFFITLITFSLTPGAHPQDYRSDVEMGSGSMPSEQKYIEIEAQFEQGLPLLTERIKDTATLVKRNQMEESLVLLKQALDSLESDEKVLTKESQYKEIQTHVDKIQGSLEKAEAAIKKNQKSVALDQLTRAYRNTQAIADSPVLRLAATEIALGNASRQIQGRNYRSAGFFLQKAVDNLTSIQNDPRINQEDIKRLKNNIIITQQQVVMGKLQDEKKLKNFYPGLAAARVNTLNTYYDIWSRNDMPWEMY